MFRLGFATLVVTLLAVVVSVSSWAQNPPPSDGNQPPARHLRVGEIPEGETGKLVRRVKALRLTSIGIGPYGSSKAEGNPLNYGVSLYKHFEAGVNGEILLGLMGAFSSTTTFLFGGVGGSYLFSAEDISPVLGGEFGFGLAHYDDKSGNEVNQGGFGAKVNAGVRFFRTSDAQMEVLATYGGLFTSQTPSFYGLEIRVLF